MPRLAIADFVDDFFRRALFQEDDAVAISALAGELSENAQIK